MSPQILELNDVSTKTTDPSATILVNVQSVDFKNVISAYLITRGLPQTILSYEII
jgi:hypothetical protein